MTHRNYKQFSFVTGLLSVLPVMLLSTDIQAQSISTETRFFCLSYAMQPPPSDRHAHIDSMIIHYQSQDTCAFTLHGGYNGDNDIHFLKTHQQVYILDNNDTVLLYDYSLEQGDTFRLNYARGKDSFITDSVSFFVLNDGKPHKHWYLRSIGRGGYMVWVENLGEKNTGWDYYSFYGMADIGSSVKAICRQQELIYWDEESADRDLHTPGCDFDSLTQLVSLNTLRVQAPDIYPNPCSGTLHIKHTEAGQYCIFSAVFSEVCSGTFSNSSIDVSGLETGIYYLSIATGTGIQYHYRLLRN